MSIYLQKILITTLMVVVISEVARRSSVIGALIASLPVVYILSMIWLFKETQDLTQVVQLSQNIVWLVLPSLLFFICFPWLITLKLEFYPALFISAVITTIGYLITLKLIEYFGLVS